MKKLVINRTDLVENINKIIETAGNSKVIAVLKGNGYGLGLVPFAKLLIEQGIDFFAVSELEEAQQLREAEIAQEILLLSSTAVEQDAIKIVDLGLTASIGSLSALNVLEKTAQGKPVKAHLKIDTGFGRFGLLPGTEKEVAAAINNLSNVEITGAFTHLSFSFATERKPSQIQLDIFSKYISNLESEDISIGIKHIANSCAFLRWDDFRLDAVRVGSAFLGRLPLKTDIRLNRIGVLKSQIIEVKNLPKGHNIGYANTLRTRRDTVIGILPIGYKDGYGVERQKDTFRFRDTLRYMLTSFLAKPNRALIAGKSVPLLGRIGMYNIIVDITGLDVKIGDDAILECNPILLDGGVERSYE